MEAANEHGLGDRVLLTIPEVAKMLRLSNDTVRRWIKQGAIAHVRLNTAVRVPREEVNRFVKDRTTTSWSAAAGRGPAASHPRVA